MASVILLAAFLLCSNFPVGAQDTRTYCPGSCLREYVDKGYCAYTYVVPPGSRAGGCSPPIAIRATSPGGSLESRTNSNRIDNRYICTDRERSRCRKLVRMDSATGDAKEIALSSRRSGYQAIEVTQMSGASRRSSCAVWNSPQLQRLIRRNQEPCLSEITQTAIRRISAECRREGSP
ncbi:Angiopoietin 4 [Branchiostoma belcheri]|nr:Angiopoietin 4 [Branchiostoma belcheri]